MLNRIVTLLDEGQPGILPVNLPFVSPDRFGRYFIGSRRRNQVLVFDGAGRLQTMLRAPGGADFRRISSILVGPGDSLYVYDAAQRKLVIYDRDLKHSRIVPMGLEPDFIRDDGTAIVAEQVPTAELIGHPIHLVDPKGNVMRSFGTETPQFRNDLRPITDRIVAPGTRGSVWAAAPGRYVIDRWDPVSGNRLAQISVHSSWFKESISPIVDERVRPRPLLESLWEREGVLWVLLRDADATWKAPSQANVERVFDLDEYNSIYDWVLEAVDAGSGDVIASKRFAKALWGRAPSPLITSRGPAKVGQPLPLEVSRPELKRKEQLP